MTDRPMKPMRHRWHFGRKGKHCGDVHCLRCDKAKPPAKYWRHTVCKPKAIVVRDRRAS